MITKSLAKDFRFLKHINRKGVEIMREYNVTLFSEIITGLTVKAENKEEILDIVRQKIVDGEIQISLDIYSIVGEDMYMIATDDDGQEYEDYVSIF